MIRPRAQAARAPRLVDPLAEPPAVLVIPELILRRLRLTVVGTAPYLSHAFSARAVASIEAKQAHQPRASPQKPPRDPGQEFRDSIHRTADGHPAIPVAAFQGAAIATAPYVGLARPLVKAAVRMEGHLLPIEGPEPRMRHDMRRLKGRGIWDPVYRAEFWPWSVRLSVVYHAGLLRSEELVNLLRTAGFVNGVGDGRPMSREGFCSLQLGTFDVLPEVISEPLAMEHVHDPHV